MRKCCRCVLDTGIEDLAEDLRLLSDPNRLRIICLLAKGEKCVCEVERELGISQQLASHHLGVLKERGFLGLRKKGTSSYYSIEPARMERTMRSIISSLGMAMNEGSEAARGGMRAGSCAPPAEKTWRNGKR